MELVILIIGTIAAISATWFAFNAWRKPLPYLELVKEKARYTKTHDRRYILEIDSIVKNSSSVDVLIKDIKINGISLKDKKKEEISLDNWGVKKILLYEFVPVWPDFTVTANTIPDEGVFYVVINAKKEPKKVKIKIITSKRSFSFCIKNVEYVNIEEWVIPNRPKYNQDTWDKATGY